MLLIRNYSFSAIVVQIVFPCWEIFNMRHQKKRLMLEPVLENYMGPPISYTIPSTKPHCGTTTTTTPSKPIPSAEPKQSKSTSLNPLNLFGKLRDRYIKAMNEMATGGDFAGVAGYQGCLATSEYPNTADYHRPSAKEREIEALREELAALRRNSKSEQSVGQHCHFKSTS